MTEPKPERIAVVGASSQIGQALLPRLAAAGYAACRIGREDRATTDGFTTHVFEESNSSFSPQLQSADVVISLAPLPSIEVVVRMAQALGAKRIIAFGSTGRFSKRGSTSAIEQDFVLQQERAEITFASQCEAIGIGWTLFRPTMIYGVNADQNVSFITSMICKFGFFPMPIGAGGLRQPVHVNDLAGACVSVLERVTTINKAYNLGGGEVLSFPELVKRIFQAAGKRPILIPIPMVLFLLLIATAQKFSKTSFVRKEMVERMFQNLIADNHDAIKDFGYAPQSFSVKEIPNPGRP